MAYSASEFEYLIPWSTHAYVVAVELQIDAEVDGPTTLSKKSY